MQAVRNVALGFGAFACVQALLFVWVFLNPASHAYLRSSGRPDAWLVLWGASILLHVLLATGLWRRKRWAYRISSGYLVVVAVGLPLGTVLGLLGLRLLRRPTVRSVFGYPT
jgi:hypothetical protein